MTDFTFPQDAQDDFNVYSDLYKDAHGIRPRGAEALSFLGADADRRQAMLHEVAEFAARQAEWEREAEQAAHDRFEARIADTIALGAGNRATAIRWIIQAEGQEIEEAEFALYSLGLSFQDRAAICNEVGVAVI